MKQKIQKLKTASKQKLLRQKKTPQEGVPRITNDSVASHREEVLSSARKYIYPLQHSRYRIVKISIVLFALLLVGFLAYMILSLYHYKLTTSFVYNVTRVLPFPVAKAGSSFVSYENYLFEVRRYKHYYETQQRVDFNEESGRDQLESFQQQALERVIRDAYVKQLASEHKISVSDSEIDAQISLMRAQNRLGGSERVLEDVLREYWNWSMNDFRRQLKKELLAQKVMAELGLDTKQQVQTLVEQLQNGGDFAALAKEHSADEVTAANGGEYGIDITRSIAEIPLAVMEALFTLEKGGVSGAIMTAQGYEIVKVLETDGSTVKAAHILIPYQDIEELVEPLRQQGGVRRFINLGE